MPRDRRLDVLRGGLILSVVVGHLLETNGGWGWDDPPQRAALTVIYAVHMPAFVFLTGVHARADSVVRRVARLVSLLVVFQALFLAVRWALGNPEDDWLWPYWVLWYVMAMIWWQALMPTIARFPRIMLAASVGIALGAGLISVHGNWFAFSRTAVFLPFFVAGYLWGRRALRHLPGLPPIAKITAVAVFLIGAGLLYLADGDPHWLFGNWGYDQLGVGAAAGMLGRLGVLAVAVAGVAALLMLVPARVPVLERPGRHSLAIFVFHVVAVEVYAVTLGAWTAGVPAVVAVALAFAVAVALTALFSAEIFERWCRAVFRLPDRMAPPAVPQRPAPSLRSGDAE